MPEFFTFLIKVNIALVLFCLGYYLVLRKLTFYTLNRAYLVTAIIFSSVYPFIDLTVFAQRHQEIVAPVQNVVVIWQAPAQNLVKQAAYWNWLEVLFWTGATVFAARLLFQLASLYMIYHRSTEGRINGKNVRVVKGDISPFSFWKSIYVNPEKLSSTDLHNVLAHEQVHVDEWHTLDVLLTEISVIFYWFNPGIWMMKRAVRENIEFITDRKILQKGLDSKAYQYSLLNITFNQPAPAITSNFNFSTLKKRITMMNAKRSSNLNLTRYAFLVPVVVVCLFTFSLSKAEVVKNNPVYKTVKAATMKTLDKFDAAIVSPKDTTPTRKKVTRTITITTDGGDKPKRTINITTNDNVTDVVTIKADSISHRTISNNSFNRNRLSVVNTDTLNNIIINGKNASRAELLQLIREKPMPIAQSLREVVVNGRGTTTLRSDMLNRDLANITLKQGTTAYLTLKDSVVDVNGFKIVKGKAGAYSLESTLKDYNVTRGNLNADRNREIVVTGYPTRALTLSGARNIRVDTTSLTERYKLAGKLIVINGKISTDKAANKIPANDIAEMAVLLPRTAVSLYGDKANKGAVIITTKK